MKNEVVFNVVLDRTQVLPKNKIVFQVVSNDVDNGNHIFLKEVVEVLKVL